jgi:hypothetical protein
MRSGRGECVCVCVRACVFGGRVTPFPDRLLLCHVGLGLRKHAEGEESFLAVSCPCVVPQLIIAFRMIRSFEKKHIANN